MKGLLFLFVCSIAIADFPPKVTVILTEKMSCREIKRVFQKGRLFVQCENRAGLLENFSADYFGKANLQSVLKEIRSYPKVKTAQRG